MFGVRLLHFNIMKPDDTLRLMALKAIIKYILNQQQKCLVSRNYVIQSLMGILSGLFFPWIRAKLTRLIVG